jgi:hypothetical protein
MRRLIIIVLLFLLGCNSDIDPNTGTWISTAQPERKYKLTNNEFSITEYEFDADEWYSYEYIIIERKKINTDFENYLYAIQRLKSETIDLVIIQKDSLNRTKILSGYIFPYLKDYNNYKTMRKLLLKSISKGLFTPLYISETEYDEISKLPTLDNITEEFYVSLLEKSIVYVDSYGTFNSAGYGGGKLYEGIFYKVLIDEGYNPFKSIDKVIETSRHYNPYINNADSIRSNDVNFTRIDSLQGKLLRKSWGSID